MLNNPFITDQPAHDVIVVTPSDTVDLATAVRAIRATAAGTVAVITKYGNTVTCAFLAGETRAIYATRIMATNTTATGLEGMV
jgi:hydroxymethylglutaryl-CoA reductase